MKRYLVEMSTRWMRTNGTRFSKIVDTNEEATRLFMKLIQDNLYNHTEKVIITVTDLVTLETLNNYNNYKNA